MYSDFKRQFVTRTMACLEKDYEEYEVTMMLNLMMGLVIYPRGKIPIKSKSLNISYDFSSWKIKENNKPVVNPSFLYVFSRVRNALAHSHIEPNFEEKRELILRDYYVTKKRKKTYVITVSLLDFKNFAKTVAEVYLKHLNKISKDDKQPN